VIGNRARAIVIGVVTFVWAANFLGGIVIHGYTPNESINAIFMGIVGSLFALGGSRKQDDDVKRSKKKEPDTSSDETDESDSAEGDE
jgi:hypothetical protein